MLSEQSFFTEIIFETHNCTIYIITRSEQVAHLSFSSERHLLAVKKIQSIYHNDIIKPLTATNNLVCIELKEYLSSQRRNFDLPTDPFFFDYASPLRQRIWQQITTIPYGETATYGDIGRQLGNPALARAVGQAAKANPVALIIPCHRITAANDIGGYAGGPAIKKDLLRMERTNRRGEDEIRYQSRSLASGRKPLPRRD